MSLETALETGDTRALETTLAANPDLANTLIVQGDHAAHPIHSICDRVFGGRLDEGTGLAMVRALISAGAALDHVHAANSDGLVSSAISLSCPEIAQLLIDAGAPTTRTGLFDATPLYWAAIMGMPELVERLLSGADLRRPDREFGSTPLGWAIEGWAHPPKGSRGGQVECIRLLVQAGSTIEPQWLTSDRVKADPSVSAALGLT